MSRGASPEARPTVASFVAAGPIEAGRVALDEDAAHHARVRRLDVGDAVTVRDGRGAVGRGRVVRLAKQALDLEIEAVDHVPPPPPLHLLAPAGDRDRMLWLAEKAVEVGVASWHTVRWERSRSVSPRGEGEAFVAKLRARAAQALAQSEGAWLPTVVDAVELDRAIDELPAGARVLLDGDGAEFERAVEHAVEHAPELGGAPAAICLALGPEGGLEAREVARLEAAGFRRARLPGNVLRFETAGVLGLAFSRALLERRADAGRTPPVRR